MKFKIKKKRDDRSKKKHKSPKVKQKTVEEKDALFKFQSEEGLKFSKKRAAVTRYFLQADRHFTVEQLYKEIKKIYPDIGYSTVYRTLKLLADLGLADECDFEEGVARFEPVHKAQHHDHFICQICGKIIEFENRKIEKLQQDVAKKYKFSIEFHRLVLYGLCSDCKKKQRGN